MKTKNFNDTDTHAKILVKDKRWYYFYDSMIDIRNDSYFLVYLTFDM